MSREAIKQLLESLIVKARLVSQKALIIIYIATLRVIGAISPLSSSILAYDDVCDKLKVHFFHSSEDLIIQMCNFFLLLGDRKTANIH